MSLQLCYVDSESMRARNTGAQHQRLRQVVPLLRKVIDWHRRLPERGDDLPTGPSVDTIADQFCRACRRLAGRHAVSPLEGADVFPIDLCTGILTLPLVPPDLGDRWHAQQLQHIALFHHPTLRAKFPTCEALSEALQRPSGAADGGNLQHPGRRQLSAHGIHPGHRRRLVEPHRDIPEKLFSMVIYCSPPDAAEWAPTSTTPMCAGLAARLGTSIRCHLRPGQRHGTLRPRPIVGVRRLMEINYARSDCATATTRVPERPISLS